MRNNKPADDPIRAGAKEILFVCSQLLVGGTERQLAAIASALVRSGWWVGVYSLAGSGTLQTELERGGVTVILPPLNRSLNGHLLRRVFAFVLAVAHLFFTMLKRRPAIVHFMLPEAYLVGGILALIARLPIRIMSRRSLNVYQQERPVLSKIERLLHRAMNAILGNSKSVIRQLNQIENVPLSRLGLIYNGVDIDQFSDNHPRINTRTALGLGPEMLALIMVGNLIPYKGHGDLIDALHEAAHRLPEGWRVFIVGRDDGIGPALQKRVGELGLENNIVFLGQRRDVADLLSACDIGLLCSHQEGFSNSVLESMASGLPMVVTDGRGRAS